MPSLKSLIGNRNPLRLLWHKGKAFVATVRYGFPARHLTVIGVTGTDGKTTTVGMVAHILMRSGIRTGSVSSANIRIADTVQDNPSQKTSPSPFVMQRILRQCVKNGCTHVVLEYSSHGLVQSRLAWTWPSVAAVTNTAIEHLDYHGSMEQYRRDKGILFEMLRGRGTKILNADDATAALYDATSSKQTIIYSPLRDLHDIQTTERSTSAQARIDGCEYPLRLSIPGTFNLSNALCAIACARAVGIATEQAIAALADFAGTPGRMERIEEGQPFLVFVDFAITPQAIEKTLLTVRAMLRPGKRILVLTGSCGDRMREKRPIIGRLCSTLADVIVITDDESYTEDPLAIMEDVWAGIDPAHPSAHKIPDRREAIRFILRQAGEGDAVVLCGMGSYPSRMTVQGPIPWNEQEIVRNALRNGEWKMENGK